MTVVVGSCLRGRDTVKAVSEAFENFFKNDVVSAFGGHDLGHLVGDNDRF